MNGPAILARMLAVLGLALLVAACGGGGEASDASGRLHPLAAGSEGPSLEIDPASWQQVGSRRVTRTVYEYTYRASVRNRGAATTGVRALLASRTASTAVVDGELQFGEVGSGAVKPSIDTFTIQHDRTVPFDPTQLAWTLHHDAVAPALAGPADAAALSLLPELLAPRVAAADLDGHTILTRLRLALAPGATVAQFNAAAARVGGRIVSSSPGSPFVALEVPRAASHAELLQRAQALDGMPGVALAYPASTAATTELPAGSRIDEMWHLLDNGFPSAWHTRRLSAQRCTDNPVTIVQIDMFGVLPASHAAFDQQLPEPIFGRSRLDLQDIASAETHGYDVALTLAAAFDAARPTGAIAAPECVRILPVNVLGIDAGEIPRRLRQLLKSLPGQLIVTQSTAFPPPRCGPRADQDCTLDTAESRLAASQTPSAELRRTVLARVSSAIDWAAWLRDPSLDLRVLYVRSVGNSANDLVSRIFPGFADARLASPIALADELEWIDTLLALRSLWTVSADFTAVVSASALLTPADGETVARWLASLSQEQRRPAHALAMAGSMTWPLPLGSPPVRSTFSSLTDGLVRKALYVKADIVRTIDGHLTGGTSYAAPQVAALAATLWSLSPELRARPPADTLALLRATGKPLVDGSGLAVDAYAAVVALDAPNGPGAIRRAILDVNGDGRFDHEDLRLYAQAYGIGGTTPPVEPAYKDHGRYDLNGDGYTGGSRRATLDLDARLDPTLGLPVHAEKLDVEYRSQPLDERALTDLEVLCFHAFSKHYVGNTAQRDELLDAAVCGDLTIEVTVPQLVSRQTSVSVRVLEVGQPILDGDYFVRISAVCADVLDPQPFGSSGVFTSPLRPIVGCGPTVMLTIQVLRRDGSVAATKLVDAQLGLPFADYRYITGAGLRVHNGSRCPSGRLCTLTADDDGVSLSLGQLGDYGRFEGRSSVTLCPQCGTGAEVWVHGRRAGRSSITVISGTDAWRVEVWVGESGISLGTGYWTGPLGSFPATLTPAISIGGLETSFAHMHAVRTEDVVVHLNTGNPEVVPGISRTGFTRAPVTTLTLAPGDRQIYVVTGGPSGGGETNVSLSVDGADHFTPAPTRVVVRP